MLLNAKRLPRDEGGFTLVELMITVLIVTIGLLGLAKLQATAVANTSISRTRALMTYQAESLAGMMRANKGFWVTTGLGTYPTFSIDAAGNLSLPPSSIKLGLTGTCVDLVAITCSAANLAWDDLNNWATDFKTAFPGARAAVTCAPASGSTCVASPATPNGYDITLTWDQKQTAINQSTAGSTTLPVSMVMHIQP